MAALPQAHPKHDATMTLEEYLRTSFRPDCDFVDDHIEERHLGDRDHSYLQARLAFWFISHETEWNIRAATEYRTRVSSSRVRLPDVSVAYDEPGVKEKIRVTPPLIAIEILSPEDRMHRVVVRLADFWKMGVENVWLLDPEDRVAFTYTGTGLLLVEETRLTVAGTPIYLDLPEVFRALD